MYVVDSDWVADFLDGRPAATDLLRALAPRGVAISLITYGEIYDGIYHGLDPAGDETGFATFLQTVEILPLDQPIMRRFARIRGDLRQQGRRLPDPDLLIAATAIHHDRVLVTRNSDHFRRVPDLTLYEPAP